MNIYWRTKTFSTFLLFSDQCSMLAVSMLCTTNDLYMISLVLSELFSYTNGMINYRRRHTPPSQSDFLTGPPLVNFHPPWLSNYLYIRRRNCRRWSTGVPDGPVGCPVVCDHVTCPSMTVHHVIMYCQVSQLTSLADCLFTLTVQRCMQINNIIG